MRTKKIVFYVIASIIGIIVTYVIGILFLLLSLEVEIRRENNYIDKTNWSCKQDEFEDKYCDLYYEECKRLAENYNLSFSKKTSIEKVSSTKEKYELYLYCNEYTVYLSFLNCENKGYFEADLYYYGGEEGLGEYESFAPIVDFLNDITVFAAYDAKSNTNHFRTLYEECIENEKMSAEDEEYIGEYVGSVGYRVYLDSKHSSDGYYYMLSEDYSIRKSCHHFSFQGLLKAR
jgi:hypothetical protein